MTVPLMKPSALVAAGGALLALPLIAVAVTPRPLPPATVNLPDPAADIAPGGDTTRTAVLAGGCFWGMEAVFEEIRGVKAVETGYAGGRRETAGYRQVSAGSTGHAEGVRISFDPRQVSYGQLLKVFFAVAHDPTQHNRQGPDIGPQYRSAIFPLDSRQRSVANGYLAQLNAAGVYGKPIATQVEAAGPFFPAEDHHQDFVARNPCLLYTSPSPRDATLSRMPSSA